MSEQIMTKHKKWPMSLIAAFVLLVLTLVPFPGSVNDGVKNRVVSHALNALIQNDRVLTNGGYRRLYDCNFVKDEGRLYFLNELGIPDSVFLEQGLKPIPEDKKLDVDDGDVIISFSYQGIEGNQTNNIQFSYIFGSLGAQGYEI